jgi:hypothetical protein
MLLQIFYGFCIPNIVSKVELNPELVVILTNNQSYLTSFTYLWNHRSATGMLLHLHGKFTDGKVK